MRSAAATTEIESCGSSNRLAAAVAWVGAAAAARVGAAAARAGAAAAARAGAAAAIAAATAGAAAAAEGSRGGGSSSNSRGSRNSIKESEQRLHLLRQQHAAAAKTMASSCSERRLRPKLRDYPEEINASRAPFTLSNKTVSLLRLTRV